MNDLVIAQCMQHCSSTSTDYIYIADSCFNSFVQLSLYSPETKVICSEIITCQYLCLLYTEVQKLVHV